MLAAWTKILPYFVVEWLAKNKCERLEAVPGFLSSNPYRGIILSWRF
jgi:hypothetical protein